MRSGPELETRCDHYYFRFVKKVLFSTLFRISGGSPQSWGLGRGQSIILRSCPSPCQSYNPRKDFTCCKSWTAIRHECCQRGIHCDADRLRSGHKRMCFLRSFYRNWPWLLLAVKFRTPTYFDRKVFAHVASWLSSGEQQIGLDFHKQTPSILPWDVDVTLMFEGVIFLRLSCIIIASCSSRCFCPETPNQHVFSTSWIHDSGRTQDVQKHPAYPSIKAVPLRSEDFFYSFAGLAAT